MNIKIIFRPFLLLICLGIYGAIHAQTGVSVNTTGAAANSSAILDVSSTSQGLLTPRMTAAQRTAISSPATGLLVYQTDAPAGFYYFGGSSWTQLVTPSSKYTISMGSGDHGLRLTTTSTGAADSVDILGLGAAGNQLVNINAGSYIDPSNCYPLVSVSLPVSSTITSFSFFFRDTNPSFIMLTGTYTMQAQLYYSPPPATQFTGSEQFYAVTGASISWNLNYLSGGVLIASEGITGTVTGLSFPLATGSRLLVLVQYSVNTSPFTLQTLTGYANASVGMQ